jgi:zinc protease
LLAAAYHVPAGSHPDAPAVRVLIQILSDSPSGRLHKALVETKKASSVFGFPNLFGEPSLLMVGAEVRQESSLDAARDTFLQTIEGLGKNPPTKEEVERAKTNLLKEIELRLNSSDDVGVELSEWIGMGDWRLLFLDRDRLRKVSVEDVQRVAGAYLKPSNRTLGLFIPTSKPDRSEIPPTPDVAAMVKDYRGDAAASAGEAFDPSPGNIDARTLKSSAGGLKLALLPKKTRGGKVVVTLVLRFGDEKSLMNRSAAADLASSMLTRGTASHTRQQIKDEFDRLKASVNIGGGPTSANVTVETTRENLAAVLKLIAEVLREPSFPAAEFEQLKQEELSGIEAQRSDPTAIGITEFRRHMQPYPKGHVKYVSTPDEDIEQLKATTLDDVKKFYADFYGASRGEMAVIGDFDDKEVARLVGETLGNWKSPSQYTRVPDVYRDIAPINKSLETPDKANAFFVAGTTLSVRDDDPDYPALVLGNYMLGGGFLNSRLVSRIRQKEGLSYGVGSQLQAGSLDKSGMFVAFAIYAPQNVAKLETAFKEEIARALKDGFTADEVKVAKTGWLQSRQVSRAQDQELAGTLASHLFLNREMAWDTEFENKVNALTPEEIGAAMRRYIDPAKITIVKAGDFAKSAAK